MLDRVLRRQKGFTLVELLMVLTIFASLSWLAIRALSPSNYQLYNFHSELQSLFAEAQFLSASSQPNINVQLVLSSDGQNVNAVLFQAGREVKRYHREVSSGEDPTTDIRINRKRLLDQSLSFYWSGGRYDGRYKGGDELQLESHVELAWGNVTRCLSLVGYPELSDGRCRL